MKKVIPFVGGVCGVLSGIGMICAAILDGDIPKFVWLFIAIGFFISGISNAYNYCYFRKKDKN